MLKQDDDQHPLESATEKEAKRLQQAEENRPTLFAQTTYLGSLALLMVIPAVGGAYLGLWIDSQFAGYSVRWTTSLIVLGIVLGAVNVYIFITGRD